MNKMSNREFEEKLKRFFEGRIIYKPYVRDLHIEDVPVYVLEYLFRRFCPSGFNVKGIEKVKEVIRTLHIEPRTREKVKQELREEKNKKILDEFEVNTDLTRDINFVHIPCLDVHDALIDESIFKDNINLLCGGMWGIGIVSYLRQEKKLKVIRFEPLQLGRLSMKKFFDGRKQFSLDEWIDILINTIGYDPKIYDQEEKIIILSRLLPLVENNLNITELGPRNTGKTYIFKNISSYSKVITGNITPAQLFYNIQSRIVGILAVKEVVIFDETQSLNFTKTDETISKLKDYMNDGSFERGGKVKYSNCSVVFIANIDVDAKARTPNIASSNYFSVFPKFLRHNTAFLERIHGLIPGWKLTRLQHSADQLSNNYGFMSDYFSEIVHGLRQYNYISEIKSKIDYSGDICMDIRDEKAILKMIDGFIKILQPHDPADLIEEIILNLAKNYAIEYRQYIYNSLREINRREYPRKIIKFKFKDGLNSLD